MTVTGGVCWRRGSRSEPCKLARGEREKKRERAGAGAAVEEAEAGTAGTRGAAAGAGPAAAGLQYSVQSDATNVLQHARGYPIQF